MQLSELDLFKLSETSPIYLKSLQSISKTQYKVWSGFTKFIKSTLSKNQSPISSEFGKFLPTTPTKFIPSVSFLSIVKVHFSSVSEANSNGFTEKQISYTAISEVCSIDRETVILCFKELLGQASQQLALGNSVRLNFRVGEMRMDKHVGVFEGRDVGDMTERSEKAHSISVATPRSSRFTTASKCSSVHPSNPNPLHQGPSANVNNYYRGLKYNNKAVTQLSPVAFYTGQIHPIFNFRNKFTRRQACEQPLAPEELLRIHQEQIKEKQKKMEIEKNAETNEFIQTQRAVKELIKSDRNHRILSEYEKRKAYETANLEQAQDKLVRTKRAQEGKKNETYDYFPFVHGDEVEAKTQSLNLSLKEDLQSYLKSVESSPLKLNKDPVVAVPKFLQTSEYLNMRRTQNYHVEQTMKGALDSYHQNIKRMEKAKEKERLEKLKQDEQDMLYYNQLQNVRKKEIGENLKELSTQIEEKLQQRFQETEGKKKLYSTSLEFSPNQYDDWERRKKHFDEYQKYLVEQIEMNNSRVKEGWVKEREIDSKILNTVENTIQREDNEARVNEVHAKSLNKDIWTKQMEIRGLEKEVGKVL